MIGVETHRTQRYIEAPIHTLLLLVVLVQQMAVLVLRHIVERRHESVNLQENCKLKD